MMCSLSATLEAQSSLFSKETYTDANGKTLQYRQFVSDYDSNSKYPLVIFLHGSGERGNDNEAQLKWGVNNFVKDGITRVHKPIVIAPQCPENQGWGNYAGEDIALQSSPTEPMRLLIELIEKLMKDMPVNPDRVYITGLSMGGFGTFDILSRKSDLFAAALPVCGGGDVKMASRFAKVHMWIIHGVLDEAVPVKFSESMYEALREAGGNPGLTIYPETGHFSWIAAYSDDYVLDWLFKQHK